MYDTLNTQAEVLNKTIFFALFDRWSWYAPQQLVTRIGDSTRVGPEARTWNDELVNTDVSSHLYAYTGPRIGWIDSGQLNPTFTPQQRRTQFNLNAVTTSPIIFGFNPLNLTDYDVATLTNKDVLAISQDPLGLGSERSVGGPNAYAVPPVYSVHSCNASSPLQQWTFVPVDKNDPTKGVRIFSNFLPNYCLIATSGGVGCEGDKGVVLMVDCVTPSPGYCSSTDKWLLRSDGLLENLAPMSVLGRVPGPFATVDQVTCGIYACHWSGIFLEQMYDPKSAKTSSLRQTWTHDPNSLLLSNVIGVSNNGTCLQAAKLTSFNIWGKSLYDGSFIMLFTNSAPEPLNVTCDTTKCFGPVHFPLQFPVSVKDLWTKAFIGVLQKGQAFPFQLEGNGGSAVFQLKTVSAREAQLLEDSIQSKPNHV